MSLPRARIVVALVIAILATACAPGPDVGGSGSATATIPPSSTTSVVPPTTVPDEGAPEGLGPQAGPPELFPVDPADLPPVDFVDGRIAFHGATAAIRSGKVTTDLVIDTLPAQPTWSRDGSRLAVVALDGREPTISIFDGETGDPLFTNPTDRLYYFLSWSHDGTRIAALGGEIDENGTPRTVLDLLDADGTVVQSDVASAGSLYVAWDLGDLRLVAHADDRLLRVDPDGTATDIGAAGLQFFAPKWIPQTDDILVVADIEGSDYLVRRTVNGLDTLQSLGEADTEIGISVNPDGRVAAISRNFEVEGGEGAERIGLPAVFPQTATTMSGAIEILDLETGTRVEVFSGLNLWAEWNPQGTHLLIYEAGTAPESEAEEDAEFDTGTWWVYEHDPTAFEPNPPVEVVTFSPTPTFARSYLAFGDQYIESPRLWSPDGTRFVYAEVTDAGSLVRTGDIDGADTPTTVGAGEVGFWSPGT
ncbi:MAG: hypothetical protein RIB98_05970 [Acidimicrobiales bacterium]